LCEKKYTKINKAKVFPAFLQTYTVGKFVASARGDSIIILS